MLDAVPVIRARVVAQQLLEQRHAALDGGIADGMHTDLQLAAWAARMRARISSSLRVRKPRSPGRSLNGSCMQAVQLPKCRRRRS